MYFLIAPDKFKGSIDSISLCELLRKEIFLLYPQATIKTFPLADGGDGFAQIIHHYFATEPVLAETLDPIGRPITATYQFSKVNETAFIEMASASGLALLKNEERDPIKASTYGTGLLVLDAIKKGAKKIILGIGGSATNDGGIGMAAALGYTFLNQEGQVISPNGEAMNSIFEIKNPAFNIVEGVEFTVACDVKNPLYGPVGAAFVYSPQKGATPDQVIVLDNGLRNLDKVFQQHFNRSIAQVSGAGAAGGLGAGCMVFLGARLIPGINYVIESIGLEKEIAAATYIITGEGGFDTQSLQGKVVGHIADLARKYHKKIHVICGESLIDDSDYTALGIAKVSALVAFAPNKEEAISAPRRFISAAVTALF